MALLQCIVLMALAAPAQSGSQSAPDPASMSADFWKDSQALFQSEEFRAVESRVSPVSIVNKAIESGRAANVQPIASVAGTHSQVVSLMKAGSDPAIAAKISGALATVAVLTTTAAERSAAQRELPKADRRAAAKFETNLSSGIAGLPGIYLDAAPIERPAAPASYRAVSGGSAGCPSQ